MSLLDVRALSVHFGAVYACDEIDLCVDSGQIIGVVGPNGSGKTTLFNAVCGQVRASQGRVFWEGTEITGWRPARIARAGLVRTFQQSMVFPSVSVRENLRMAQACSYVNASLKDGSLPFADVDLLLEQTGLETVKEVFAGALPTGLLRLLGIAVSLQANPRLLMLDEPAAGLSMAESDRLRDLLRWVHRSGVTLVVVDHDMGFLLPLCDHLVVLESGKKLIEGVPNDVATDAKVIEVYLGSQFAKGKGK